MHQFEDQIYAVLAQIPEKKVTTYGDVAKIAGFPRYARHVGRVLKQLPEGSRLPWFRVINGQGKISLTGERFLVQKQRLQQEGIEVSEEGRISLAKYRWDGEPV